MPNTDPDVIPTTIAAAVDVLVAAMTDEELSEISRGATTAMAHHGLGRWLRNNWSLWDLTTPLNRDAVKTYGLAHGDDLSSLILNWAWAKIEQGGSVFEPQAHAEELKEYWKNRDTDALTVAGWNQEEHGE